MLDGNTKVLDINTPSRYNTNMDKKLKPAKPRDFVAKDLRTPKYRMRVAVSKRQYKRITTFELMRSYDA
jgi:hypothetical protein